MMTAITPLGKNAIRFHKLRETLVTQHHRNVSWNEVITHFFDLFDLQKIIIEDLEQQVQELGGKVDKKESVIEEALLNLSKVQQTQVPTMSFQANPQIVNQPKTLNLPPPPPISPKAPTFIKEMHTKFEEGKLRPSEIQTAEFNEPIILENQ